MSPFPTAQILAQWLAGEFDNRPQALDQPIWFVHLRLWHRPLPRRINGSLALFAEQANALYLNDPYRQRVLVLQEHEGEALNAQYFAFKHPSQFQGAGANPERLASVGLDDLELLPGCRLPITLNDTTFVAQPEPDAKCYFQYQGQTRQVVLGFESSPGRFVSYDRGVDPETGQALWGAIMGPYEFTKCQDFASELPL